MYGVIGFASWSTGSSLFDLWFWFLYGTLYSFVWTLLDFSMVLSMETKSLCMVCMDGYGLV